MISSIFPKSPLSLRRTVSLALVAMITLINSTGAIAAPLSDNESPEVQLSRAQDEGGIHPTAPGRALYLPSVNNETPQLETLETSVVRLTYTATQAESQMAEIPAVLPATETSLNAVTLLQEDFEGTFPTGNWRVLDENGTSNGEAFWDEDNTRSWNGTQSAWVANGGKNGVDPDFYNYPNHLQSWMIYGPIDLSDAASAHLNFSYWNLSERSYDFLGWYASPNNTDFYGMRVSGNSQGWKGVTLDLAAVPSVGNLLGDSSVWIAFRFISDGNTTDRGAFIDQVRVQKELKGDCAGGFKAEYFNNKDLSGQPTFTRCEQPPINHNWGLSSPGNGIGSDYFSVRWSGTFDFTQGAYNFVASSDDGIRIWLDGNQIVNNWQDQGLTPNLATRDVSAGKHTIRVEYYENVGGAAAQFRWLRSNTTVSNRQAFDTCFLPTLSDMQRWWGNSPYYEIGIYIGGSNRGCKAHNEQNLTGNWISTARQQGWNVIPTWVGPQAPCTSHNFYTMSSNPDVSFSEGQKEAGDAATAARNLGLTTQELGGTVIYYDMEPYPNNRGCREAVKSFMAGWASRLHELGNQAGGYGAACASYLTDWILTPPYTVDQIWPAAWIYPGYHASASVWDVSCIDNSLWSNHQRIRQYAGDHNESWGGVTLNIDSNIVDGRVAGNIPRTQAAGSEQFEESWQPVQITGLQLLSEMSGWVISQGQFLWTEDGGATWISRTPAELQGLVRAASFVDASKGWLVGGSLPDAQGRSTLYVGKTTDSGATWQLHPLEAFNPIEPGSTQGAVELTFFDGTTGYMQIKLASSSNFDLYALLKSTDSGATWQEVAVPDSSRVHLADSNTAWTVATTTDTPMQITSDGGASWNPTDSVPTIATNDASEGLSKAATDMGAVTTSLLGNTMGWAFVEKGLCSGTKPANDDSLTSDSVATEPFDCLQTSALLATADGGTTWLEITPNLTPN